MFNHPDVQIYLVTLLYNYINTTVNLFRVLICSRFQSGRLYHRNLTSWCIQNILRKDILHRELNPKDSHPLQY